MKELFQFRLPLFLPTWLSELLFDASGQAPLLPHELLLIPSDSTRVQNWAGDEN